MAQEVSKRPKKFSESKKVGNTKPIATDPEKMVPMTLNISSTVLQEVARYRKDHGLTADQDVLRLGIARFLRQEGYLNVKN